MKTAFAYICWGCIIAAVGIVGRVETGSDVSELMWCIPFLAVSGVTAYLAN